jgi:DnaJ-class molecular chaperone
MSSGVHIRTEQEARALLQLAPGDPPATWRAAFQREAKAAHPDQGGDSERMRLVIEAYRFLKTQELKPWDQPPLFTRRPRNLHPEPPPKPAPPSRPAASRPEAPRPEAPKAEPQPDASRPTKDGRFRISIVDAFRGADKTVRLAPGRKFKVRLPPGLQTGDVVRFGAAGQHRLTIEVTPLANVELKGADLWLTVAVSAEFLDVGGRMEVDTPLGPRKFWVSRTSAARGLFRAPGEGLPARPNRPKGHLYLKFQLDESLGQRPVKSLLARFASAWAAE